MGKQVIIDFGNNKEITFKNNGKKRAVIEDDYVAVNMDVILADGSEFDAIGVFDEGSSGEHCDTFLFTRKGLAQQGQFEKATGKRTVDIFPYKYKYRKPLHCEDIHVKSDGWSS